MMMLNATTKQFSVDGENFVIDTSATHFRRPSDESAFTLVKTPEYVNLYILLTNIMKPKTILEVGVFQGGSYVMLDKLFKPDAMSAIELSPKPIAPLQNYCKSREGRFVRWGCNQVDTDTLQSIVANDLGGRLDLVVDDASHLYDETRSTFNTLFPLLSPGGYYIIEDWSWAHAPAYQGEGAPLAQKPALTNLLIDLLLLHGSTRLLGEIRIYKPFALIRKSSAAHEVPEDLWSTILVREKERPYI